MSWILVIVGVWAILNAEKLPGLFKMLDEKIKDSLDAANKGAELAKTKIEQAKKDIEAKKNAEPTVEAEENSPEEIAEALKFMDAYTQTTEQQPQPETQEQQVEDTPAEEQPAEKTPAEDAPIDLENRD